MMSKNTIGKVSVQMLLPSAKQSEKIRKKEMKERNLRYDFDYEHTYNYALVKQQTL